MHECYDHVKFKRDYIASEFTGIELCNFTDMTEIKKIIDLKNQMNFKIGIHFPLYKPNYKFRDPLLMSLDKKEQEMAKKALVKELDFAKTIDAEYLLIHFPKPMVIDKRLKWELCRFSSEMETVDEEDYPYEVFRDNARRLFDDLSNLSTEYGIQIVLEIEMLNKYLYEGTLMEELLTDYPKIKICLDSARLHVLSQIDAEFDYMKFVKNMAKYTYLIHLSNIRVRDKIENGHYPVLKKLSNEPGWCDIDEFLLTVSEENTDLKILYEHRSDLITDQELEECYGWVKSYFESV